MINEYFETENNSLKVGGHRVEDLIKEYGSPLYIYDEKILKRRLELLQSNFGGFDVFYSMKSNPNPDICEFIRKSGAYADAASIGEVRLAAAKGFEKNEIIYSAPGKKEEEIREALGKCIIIADSLNELELINEICREQGRVEDIAIRINPDYSIEGSDALEVMSGFPSKFGMDQEALPQMMETLEGCRNIQVKGIQIYMGSQIVSHSIIYSNFLNIFKVALYCRKVLGLELEFIDFGGGFGIQYTEQDQALDIKEAGRRVQELRDSEEFQELKGLRLIIESGRFLCGPAGIYVSQVVDVKTSRGKHYAIIDGGMNTFFRPVFIEENRYPIHVANRMEDRPEKQVTIGGVMCTPIDILEEDVMLPRLSKGDLLAFFNAGAYGYTMSLTRFISHEGAKELYIAADGAVREHK